MIILGRVRGKHKAETLDLPKAETLVFDGTILEEALIAIRAGEL